MVNIVISDSVYGPQHINEPVLLDLLQSSTVTRLKGIHQGGAAYLVRARRDTTRYEHSVGVMLLIRLLGGSVREQIAGLLHDVSHTAFSHVVDYAFKLKGEDFHEQHYDEFVLQSDIPDILQRYDISLDTILNHEQWSLLEQPAPDLCADRMDYTLRDLQRAGYINTAAIQQFLQSLTVHNGIIAVNNLPAALWFTCLYANLILDIFMNPLEMYADEQLAQAIRVAFEKGMLRETDLFREDEDVLRILQSNSNPAIHRALSMIRPDITVVEDTETFDVHAFTKPRIVDPLVLQNDGSLKRCSALRPEVKRLHEQVIAKATNGLRLRHITEEGEDKPPPLL